jgi:hypothetical protein
VDGFRGRNALASLPVLRLFVACMVGVAPPPEAAASEPAADVLYRALFGEPMVVDAGQLLATPGRFVGRAVRTRGRLERSRTGKAFELSEGPARAALHLEPQAAAVVNSHSEAWVGKAVEVEGLFYRDLLSTPEAPYALRAWLARAVEPATTRLATAPGAPVVALRDLIYGGGGHDGKPVRVRGEYRGSNIEHDLPEATRKGAHDWILKDGYFAVWVSGLDPASRGSGSTGASGGGVALEVVGIPTTSEGVVRLEARLVEASEAAPPAAVGRARATADAGMALVPPHLSFVYPVDGESLGPRGRMVLQFSKSMDPSRLEGGVRVRYERSGAAVGTPHLTLAYRDRYRALVISPEPPPPQGSVVLVDLLDGIIDVDGRALIPPAEPLRFLSGR